MLARGGGLSGAALSDLPKYDTRVYYIKPSAEGALREESLRRPPRQMPTGGHFGGRSDGRSAGDAPRLRKALASSGAAWGIALLSGPAAPVA